MNNTTRRIGVFYLNGDLVRNADPKVTRIMGMCSIMHAEHRLMTKQVFYAAVCFKFREVQEGESAPEYRWVFHADGSVDCEEIPNTWDLAAHGARPTIEEQP